MTIACHNQSQWSNSFEYIIWFTLHLCLFHPDVWPFIQILNNDVLHIHMIFQISISCFTKLLHWLISKLILIYSKLIVHFKSLHTFHSYTREAIKRYNPKLHVTWLCSHTQVYICMYTLPSKVSNNEEQFYGTVISSCVVCYFQKMQTILKVIIRNEF